MAGINGLSSGADLSILFGSGNQKSNVDYSSVLNLDLADVASVRNGSYGKLLKQHYAGIKADAKAVDGDTDKKLTSIKTDADKLVKAADAFNDSSLFETKKIDGDGGKQTEEFADKDKLGSAVKDFVKAYNAAIDSAGESGTKSVLRTGGWMANMTKQNAGMLSAVGITVGGDDKLSFDEEAFKKADVTTVKDVFSGVNSYASQVSAKAGSLSRATATTEALYDKNARWTPQAQSFAKENIERISGSSGEDTEKTEEKPKTTLTEADSEKLTGLQDQRSKLMKEYEKLDNVEKIREYDRQIADIDKQIKELNGAV